MNRLAALVHIFWPWLEKRSAEEARRLEERSASDAARIAALNISRAPTIALDEIRRLAIKARDKGGIVVVESGGEEITTYPIRPRRGRR